MGALVLGALLLLLAYPTGPATATAAGDEVTVAALRANWTVNPLGIDDTAPSLGWQLRSQRRGVTQTAYQVQVAADAEDLAGESLIWDSGMVSSPESVSVPYGGPPPQSGQRLVWRVRVWDEQGQASPWSATASWEVGLLTSAAWQGAEWIAPEAATDAANWIDYRLDVDFTLASGAAGVVFRERDPSNLYMWQIAIDDGGFVLRPHRREDARWTVLGEVPIDTAVVGPGEEHATHHLTIEIAGTTIATAIDGEQVDVREDRRFAVGGVGFRSGGSFESARFDQLEVHDLDDDQLFADDFSSSPDPAFEDATVTGGQLLVQNGDAPRIATTPLVPLLRRNFTLDRPVATIASARLYASGLGSYEFRLSGEKVGDRELAPAATHYSARVRYQTYDVTSLLREGGNALGVTLAEGYGPTFSRYGNRWLGPRQALALLEIVYADGSRQHVITDESWRWGEGPIRDASLYDGETYDARLDPSGWDEAGFDASAWRPVAAVAAPEGALEADTTPPVRVVRTIQPLKVTQPDPGTEAYVFDLGENVSGWARLRVGGAAGEVVRLRYAEDVYADGTIDTTTNRSAVATDTYVLAGGGEETFEPSFTYHGFRYVEVSGLPDPPNAATLEGRVVHADMASTASFESSNPLLDRIYANNRRTMANNAMSYPTDTPTRDERTGPGMDVHAYSDAAVRDFRADRYFAAYLEEIGGAWHGSPDMNAANVSLAWALYQQYGDRGTLESSYPGMAAAVEHYVEHADGYVWPEPGEGGRGFGDWCPPVPLAEANGGVGGPDVGGYDACFSEVSLVNTALAFRNARIVATAAQTLGHDAEASHYEGIAAAIQTAFESRFATSGGYGSRRQVTSVLPLAFGMVPPDRRAVVATGLVNRVLGPDSGHLDTGIFGTRFLVDALVAAGRPDVALTVLDQTTYPGYGYQIGFGAQIGLPPGSGATTAWEQWTYGSEMETHDHAMFAGINASFISRFAGIEPVGPGYSSIRIEPVLPRDLERAGASLHTVRGEVASSWHRNESALRLDVTIPPNSTAEVHVPAEPGDAIGESGQPATESPGVALLREEPGAAVYAVGSGSYSFVVVSQSQPQPPEEEPDVDDVPESPDQPRAEDPQPGPTPAPLLRARARITAAGLLAVNLACRSGCPSALPVRVNLTTATTEPRLLARMSGILDTGPLRLTTEPLVQRLPRRVRLVVLGLDDQTPVFKLRLVRPAPLRSAKGG